jgi:trk system potassium uptake protein TrkA
VTNDDETNILIAFLAKRMGCSHTIARVRNPEYACQSDYLKNEMNIDLIVNPEQAMALSIQHYLIEGSSLHMEEFADGRIVLAEIHANALNNPMGMKLKDLDTRGKVVVATIVREGNVIIPDGETTITKTDLLYLAGEKLEILGFAARYGLKNKRKKISHVVVVGGGRIGYYLTESLTATGIRVTLIEIDRERCKYMAQHFEKTLVINADGTDLSLLKAENVFSADALVAVTGHDEENLILSLLAKQFGTASVITKVSRSNYIPIIEKLGVDAAINPVTLTAGHILRFILKGKVEAFSLLFGGMAEALEITIQPDANITKGSLQQLNLPKGIIIAAVFRENEVLIPNGSSHIQPGDRIVVFLRTSDMDHLEHFFYPRKHGMHSKLWNYS